MRTRLHTGRGSERGAALLVVIVAVAVLTALAVDLVYQTRVRLQIAANARDALRAEALAHSAVAMSRLVLSFQNQIDGALGQQPGAGGTGAAGAAGTAGAAGAAGAGGGAGLASLIPRPQIWNLVPVTTMLTQSLFPGEGAPGPAAKPAAPAEGAAAAPVPEISYGDFTGGFDARIEDEGQKVNVQIVAYEKSSRFLSPQVEAILRMVCDPKWDPLFDRTDADGQRYSRADLVTHIRDWVMSDPGGAALNASFPAGNCSVLVGQPAFQPGFSDKNYPYDRGADRYRAKGAPMDSVRELHMVAGVSDAFMAAFGDRLTVYLSKDTGGINVNGDPMNPDRQLAVARLVVDPGAQAMLDDPMVQKNLAKALSAETLGGFAALSTQRFLQILQGLGLPLRKEFQTGTGGSSGNFALTDRSLVFKIRARGVAGDVSHETEAVVTYDLSQAQPTERQARTAAAQSGQLDLGQLIHWRED